MTSSLLQPRRRKRLSLLSWVMVVGLLGFGSTALVRHAHAGRGAHLIYPPLNPQIDPSQYNCAGLALRNFRSMSLEEVRHTLERFHPLVPGERCAPYSIKIWYWEYDTFRRTATGQEVPHRDFHMVAGQVGPRGEDPVLVFSKNGLRALTAPGAPEHFRPLAKEDLGPNAAGRHVWQIRYNMTEKCYTAAVWQLPQ